MAGPYYVDPAAGGTNNGSSWTNAWTSIQSAFDTAAANEIVYCRGTQTVAAQIDVDTQTGGNATGYIKFIGCNASGNVDGTRFTIQGDGANACDLLYKAAAQHMYWIENFHFKDAYGTKAGVNSGTTNGNGWVFINCYFNNNTSNGLTNGRYFNNATFYRCAFANNDAAGYSGAVNTSNFFFCSFHDNTGIGLSHTGAPIIIGCVSHDNGDDGMALGSASASISGVLFNSVIHANSDDGITIAAGTNAWAQLFILGNRITGSPDAGDFGLYCNTEPVIAAFNYFDQVSGTNVDTATDDWLYAINEEGGTTDSNKYDPASVTDYGYVSSAGDDYSTAYDADDPLRRKAITVPES